MDKYLKLDQIGKGCNGNCVVKVKNLEDGKRIYIDVVNKEENEKNMNEIKIFKSLNHENIVKYYESFYYKNKFCIIMEYADGGDLSTVIKKHLAEKKYLDEDIIWNWFLQICNAIKYIHSKNTLHRDIKSQNIFLNKKGQVKLGDFGISKVLENSMDYAKTSLGTPYFLSPEICSGNKYNFKTDIWMLGCVLYELACVKKPFEGENFHKLINNILNQEILPIPKHYSDDLKKLVLILLQKDPNLRPNINEVLSIDYVYEKNRQFNFNLSPQNDLNTNTHKGSKSNMNTLSTYSSSNSTNSNNNFNSISSPMSVNEYKSNLFNLGFGNLLKEIDEVDEEHNMNSMSPKILEKNLEMRKISEENNKIFKKHKNYNQSLLPELKDVFEEKSKIVNKVVESKNYYPTNPTLDTRESMEEKINRLRQRTKSINLGDRNIIFKNINQIDNEKVQNFSDNYHNISNKDRIPNSATKININRELSNKKITSRIKPISLNITSMESPEQKAIYFKENEDEFQLELKTNFCSKDDLKFSPEDKINNLNELEPEIKRSRSLNFNKNNLELEFLNQQIGKDKTDSLITLLKNTNDVIKLLNDDCNEIQKIAGTKHKIVQNILRRMISKEYF